MSSSASPRITSHRPESGCGRRSRHSHYSFGPRPARHFGQWQLRPELYSMPPSAGLVSSLDVVLRAAVLFSILGARVGSGAASIGIGGSSIRYFFGRPKDVELTAFRAMAPTKERDVFLTGDFWRRGSEFLPFPRIMRLTKRRARPFARLLPPLQRDLPARRRSSVTVSTSVTPTSIMSLRALVFNCAGLGCAEANSSVSSRVVQLKRPPRSWEY